jgi:hypothetical protein
MTDGQHIIVKKFLSQHIIMKKKIHKMDEEMH